MLLLQVRPYVRTCFFSGIFMKKVSILTIVVILFGSCSTVEDTTDNAIIKEPEALEEISNIEVLKLDLLSINTYPEKDTFIIAAYSPRFQYHEEEIEFALKNAAKQIAIYKGVNIDYRKLIDENIIGTLQFQEINIEYDRSFAESILEELEIVDDSIGNDHYIALIKYKSDNLPIVPEIPLHPGERPAWINHPPQFEGFITGVGISGLRKSIYDSWQKADEQAMAEIVNAIKTNIYSGTGTIERGSSSSGSSTTASKTLSASNEYISGFYILSRWRETDNSSYYTLAITRKP